MAINRPKLDYENLTIEIFEDCLRELYSLSAEVNNSISNREFDKDFTPMIINLCNYRFNKLYTFSFENSIHFEYCSFKTYVDNFEQRFKNYNLKYIDCERNDFVKNEIELINHYYSLNENNTIWNNDIKDIFINSKSKKINFLNDLLSINSNAQKHENIFSNNGFVLFEHILKEYVKTKRGRLSDIHFFYWSMHNNTPQYIHQRPERFKEWFFNNYDNEDLGQIKQTYQIENPDRLKHYSNALDWFKTQK
ncbi:hypothetical protein [Flavobacterium sp.]|jgi:hypothetical protein|uniref:hypothetical protein n=1 Tax=Flavobacterium sp. TaxID=239 RepID=UPI002A80C61B|nr:hypothetical protein [Flavobacterium sp.]